MRWAVFIGGWLAGASALATAGPSVVTEALGPNGILSAANMAEDVPLVPADIRDEVSFDYAAVQDRRARRPFESDHEFDGFVQPFSNPIQFKDPRAMTEARGLFIAAWSDPNMPLGDTSAQIYALQLRAALTERLEVFAAKDGIVRLSPGIGASQTGLANLAVGGKYVFYRDPETQTIASAVVQVEAPTGYANIFQNQGSGLLAGYVVMGYSRSCCSTTLRCANTCFDTKKRQGWPPGTVTFLQCGSGVLRRPRHSNISSGTAVSFLTMTFCTVSQETAVSVTVPSAA